MYSLCRTIQNDLFYIQSWALVKSLDRAENIPAFTTDNKYVENRLQDFADGSSHRTPAFQLDYTSGRLVGVSRYSAAAGRIGMEHG